VWSIFFFETPARACPLSTHNFFQKVRCLESLLLCKVTAWSICFC
jgi:hypothetical protein